jgi:tyrosyl-tRNA synthetase
MPNDLVQRELGVPVGGYPIAVLLKDLGLTSSTSEANRMIQQAGVRIDGERIEDTKLRLRAGISCVIQVGKRRFAKVQLIDA